jgi:hypothetical protein
VGWAKAWVGTEHLMELLQKIIGERYNALVVGKGH